MSADTGIDLVAVATVARTVQVIELLRSNVPIDQTSLPLASTVPHGALNPVRLPSFGKCTVATTPLASVALLVLVAVTIKFRIWPGVKL